MNSFYTREELKDLGLKSFGHNVLISKKCSIYGANYISIGNNVRIDDFCILSGNITIGNYVHISAYTSLFAGKEGIILEDFVGISAKSTIWGKSDDLSGDFMNNPTIPDKYKNVTDKVVILKKHCFLGSNTVVLPGVIMEEGSAAGAMSLVTKSTKPWTIYFGIPARRLAKRSNRILELEKEFLSGINIKRSDEDK